MHEFDLIARARSGYSQIAPQIEGTLPLFEEAFECVRSFYEGLPW